MEKGSVKTDEQSDTTEPAGEGTASVLPAPVERTGSPAARELALAIASAGLDKKATEIEIIDVGGKVDYTEFLVLMSGRSDRHVHAIAKGVEQDLSQRDASPLSVEGMTGAHWVLLDFNDVVVHVFQQESRCYYDLENLWIDAGRVACPEAELADGGNGGGAGLHGRSV